MVRSCQNRHNYEILTCKHCSHLHLYFLCWFYLQHRRYSIHLAQRQETQNSLKVVVKPTEMLNSPLHLHSLAASTTIHMWEFSSIGSPIWIQISQFIFYSWIWTDFSYFRLIITDSLHSANPYQNLTLTSFPHMELKISLLCSGLISMTLV